MDKDERKPKLHIHLGGLFIIIIIILILFKVDIKSKINSPQFQANLTYIENQAKDFWNNKILKPFKLKVKDTIMNTVGNEIDRIQTNFSDKYLDTKEIENLEI